MNFLSEFKIITHDIFDDSEYYSLCFLIPSDRLGRNALWKPEVTYMCTIIMYLTIKPLVTKNKQWTYLKKKECNVENNELKEYSSNRGRQRWI